MINTASNLTGALMCIIASVVSNLGTNTQKHAHWRIARLPPEGVKYIPNDDDQTFELLPMNDEVYTSEDIPWSKGSVPHYNRDKIVMQILKKPSIHRLSNKFAEDLFETHCEDRLELQSR